MSAFWVLLLLILAVIGIGVLVYNRLVALRQTCKQAWSDIDVQLKQRWDLIPNLIETVKGYAAHEKETLESVVRARQTAVEASSVKDQAAAENLLTGALRQLFALSESYPDLKASQNFLSLQTELSDLENKIAAARRFYNNAAGEYNAAREQIPAVFFAQSLGFQEQDFFELDEAEQQQVQKAPEVKF